MPRVRGEAAEKKLKFKKRTSFVGMRFPGGKTSSPKDTILDEDSQIKESFALIVQCLLN